MIVLERKHYFVYVVAGKLISWIPNQWDFLEICTRFSRLFFFQTENIVNVQTPFYLKNVKDFTHFPL